MRHRGDGFAEEPGDALGGWRLSGVANRKIDALLTQVGETVVRRNAKIDARMELLQSTQARQEPESGHADARAQHHRTHGAERANLTHHVLQLLQGPIRAAKQALAYVPDDPHLFDRLTVWEHFRFISGVYRLSNWQERAEQLLKRLELVEKRDAPTSDLSRGMRQKVAIGCAYLHEPRAILFDEPLTGLDPRGIRRLKDSIAERARAVRRVEEPGQAELVRQAGRHLDDAVRGEHRVIGQERSGPVVDEASARVTHLQVQRVTVPHQVDVAAADGQRVVRADVEPASRRVR